MLRIEKRYYFESLKAKYHLSGKVDKGKILSEICESYGCERKYAIKCLSKAKSPRKFKPKKRGRKSKYDYPELKKALQKIWMFSDQACSPLLKQLMPVILPFIEKHYYQLQSQTKEDLLKVSARTMDRLLAPVKVQLKKGKSGTKPGKLIRQQIPVSTICWEQKVPGFLEVDTVAHCGGSLSGEFIWSLTATDIATTWTELRVCWNKGAEAVCNQISNIEELLPFPIKGFDCDCGSEFLNYHLLRYFTDLNTNQLRIAFTRARAYHKNDNCHVEQKNWSHARQLLGYQRLDIEEFVPLINDVLRNEYSLFKNHFIPTFKLDQKILIKTRHKRIYGTPTTPYQRVLNSEHISDDIKKELIKLHESLDPVILKQNMERKLRNIFSLKSTNIRKLEPFSVP